VEGAAIPCACVNVPLAVGRAGKRDFVFTDQKVVLTRRGSNRAAVLY
jgi:hypothetical protein